MTWPAHPENASFSHHGRRKGHINMSCSQRKLARPNSCNLLWDNEPYTAKSILKPWLHSTQTFFLLLATPHFWRQRARHTHKDAFLGATSAKHKLKDIPFQQDCNLIKEYLLLSKYLPRQLPFTFFSHWSAWFMCHFLHVKKTNNAPTNIKTCCFLLLFSHD